MRTRFIVAIAALIAASALVAGPDSAGARQESVAQTLNTAQFRSVMIEMPADSPVTSISPTLDTANRSAGWLGPATALAESGVAAAVAGARPTRPQPTVTPKVTPKARWRFDPNVSWYGPGMYGSRTACGVTLTKSVMGVASRTLPCGTKVTFRNPETGHKVKGDDIVARTALPGNVQTDRRPSVMTSEHLDHCYTGSIYWKLAGS